MGTKWIRLKENISGGRADGRPWPPANEVSIEVADWEAEHGIAAGYAYEVDAPEPEKAPAPVKAVPARAEATAAVPVQQEGLTPPEAVPAPPDSPEPAEDDAEPPRPSDSKQDWIDFAVARGMTADKATALSKADLMSRFGGRL